MEEKTRVQWAEPSQARAHVSMKRMLDAAQHLLEDVNFNDLKVKDVCGAAKVSIGAFYNRFKTKEGLLNCLEERYLQQRERILQEALGEQDMVNAKLFERVNWVARVFLRFNRERRGLFRTFRERQLMGHVSWDESDFREHQELCSKYFDFLLECRNEINHPNPDRAVRIGFISMVVVLDQVLLFPHTLISAALDYPDEVLAEEMARQCLAYLGW